MAASTYRYLLLDSATLRVQAELPLILSATYGDVLNDRGSFSVTIPLDLGGLPLTLADLAPGKALFVVERDAVPVYAGWVWTWEADIEGDTFTLNGEGWLSYLGRRVWDVSRAFNMDQVVIIEEVVDEAQSRANGYVGIVNPLGPLHGYTRQVVLAPRGGLTYERILQDLSGSNLDNGVDWAFLPYWTGSPPELRVSLYQHPLPRLGRDSGIVLELGVNAELLRITGDGTRLRTRAEAIGAGNELAAPVESVEDTFLASTLRLLEVSEKYNEVADPTQLEALATRDLAIYRDPILIPSVRLDESVFFGHLIVGDRLQVVGGSGLVSMDETYRLTSWTATTEDGQTTVELTLAPLSSFI